MASTANDMDALDGNFKDQFHKNAEDLLPDHVLLQKGMIEWIPGDKLLGQLYSVPTLLRRNHGVSYLGESGDVGDLQDAVAGVMKEAQIKGSELNVRGWLSYKAMSSASAAGPKAFKKAAGWLVDDLAAVAHERLEASILYGQSGLGTVESVTDLGSNQADIVITTATFAPGIWAGAEGAKIDSFTTTTKNNGTQALVIDLVTLSSRTLKVTYGGAIATESAASDVLYFTSSNAGSSVFNEMVGLYKQFTAVTGTLFGINKASYTLIQGNEVTGVAALTKAKIVDASMRAVEKGGMSNLTALVSTKAWAKLHAEDLALRMFDSSYSSGKAKSGSREMEIDFLAGSIKVVCHPMVKYGEIFIFNPDDVIFVGSIKGVTFEVPGMSEKFFRFVADKNALELQAMADCAVYALKPCQTVLMSGITYS